LSINLQTGAIQGAGPGVIRSTRFGDALAMLASPQPAAQGAAPPTRAAGSKLHFLHVDFQKGLTGNLVLRDVAFHDRVRALYGPVDAWEQELDLSRPESLPPEAMTLSSEMMRINENPMAARIAVQPATGQKTTIGPIQFQATGNVCIDGQEPKRGAFRARADEATYDQLKDTFVLQGTPRTPATLWWAGQQGAPAAAQSIRYVRSTGDYQINQLQPLELNRDEIENARRPASIK
jgi:hypothetical protein